MVEDVVLISFTGGIEDGLLVVCVDFAEYEDNLMEGRVKTSRGIEKWEGECFHNTLQS